MAAWAASKRAKPILERGGNWVTITEGGNTGHHTQRRY